MVGLINYVSKVILRKLTFLQGRQSESEQRYAATVNTMLISFMNIGIIVLLVNLSIKVYLPLPILQGQYDKFSVEWYRLVGTNLCV